MKESFRTLVVGVTGRRHIAPYALRAVEESTRAIFDFLAQVEDAHVVLETGLAIGADSLAARAALDAKRRGAKLLLRAVLPMPQHEYSKDFKTTSEPGTPSELDDFRALVDACDDVVEIPIVERKTNGEFSREAQYAALGERLVRESDLLLAYWSGDASKNKPGGTVDVVTRKLRAIATGARGRVLSIATPENFREKNPDGSKRFRPELIDSPGACALDSGAFAPVASALESLAFALDVTLRRTE